MHVYLLRAQREVFSAHTRHEGAAEAMAEYPKYLQVIMWVEQHPVHGTRRHFLYAFLRRLVGL